MWICIAPCREHTSKALRYGTRSQGISQFYLHTPHSFANGMNHTCLCTPAGMATTWSVYISAVFRYVMIWIDMKCCIRLTLIVMSSQMAFGRWATLSSDQICLFQVLVSSVILPLVQIFSHSLVFTSRQTGSLLSYEYSNLWPSPVCWWHSCLSYVRICPPPVPPADSRNVSLDIWGTDGWTNFV